MFFSEHPHFNGTACGNFLQTQHEVVVFDVIIFDVVVFDQFRYCANLKFTGAALELLQVNSKRYDTTKMMVAVKEFLFQIL